MTKTPYEVRLDLLKLANDRAVHENMQAWEKAGRDPQTGQLLKEVPNFPTTEQILLEAEKLKSFVDKG